MSKKPRTYSKAGRPPVDRPSVKKSVSMLPEVYQYLVLIGDGVLSHGVKAVAEFHEEFSKLETPKGSS